MRVSDERLDVMIDAAEREPQPALFSWKLAAYLDLRDARASVVELETSGHWLQEELRTGTELLKAQAPVIEAARRQLAAVSDHMPPSPEEWVRWVAATDEVHRTIAVLDGKE